LNAKSDEYSEGTGIYWVTDHAPGQCPDYYWYSTWVGWCDWGPIEAEGNFMIWLETSCCDYPVTVEHCTWGHLKSLYR